MKHVVTEHQKSQTSETADPETVLVFEELYQFMRESTGLAMTTAYILLLLSSMGYLYILFSAFDISIVKYVSLEDILATPIKNPDIILIFCLILFVLYLADLGNRIRAWLRLKYAEKPMPLGIKFINAILWSPRHRRANIKVIILTVVLCLSAYIFSFAHIEAENVKEGHGEWVEISLADDSTRVKAVLLGATSAYLFTYSPDSQTAITYSLEAVTAIGYPAPPAPRKQASVIDMPSVTPKKASPVN